MRPVTAGLKPNDRSEDVVNLQDAILVLLDNKLIQALDPPNQPTEEELQKLAVGLKRERAQSVFGKATQQLVRYFQIQRGLGDNLNGVVEDKTATGLNRILKELGVLDEPSTNEFTVKGKVTLANGTAAANMFVRAFDRDLRNVEPVGKQTRTHDDGSFEISYSREQFTRSEKDNADLFIRVYAADAVGERDKLLVESPTLFNAPAVAEINVELPQATTQQRELERNMATLQPLFAGQGTDGRDLDASDLEDKDFDFIVGETGLDREQVRLLALAAKMARDEGQGNIPQAAFYGWFRQELPTDWKALTRRPIRILRKALLDAIDQGIVPASLREQIDSILDRIPNPSLQELSALPAVTGLPAEKRRELLKESDGVSSVTNEVLAQLITRNALSANEARAVGLNVSLHGLAGGEPSIVRAMIEEEFPSVKTGRLRQTSDLAALEPADWHRVLEKSNSPIPEGMKRADYARGLAMRAVNAFPTAGLVHRAGRIPQSVDAKLARIQPLLGNNRNATAVDFDSLDLTGINDADRPALRDAHAQLRAFANLHPGLGLHEALSNNAPEDAVAAVAERMGWLNKVFDQNPDVRFLTLDYLPGSADLRQLKFGDLSEEARGRVLQDLKAHQRIHTVTNNVIPAAEIMSSGYHSASAIALTRQPDFLEKVQLPPAEAQAYYMTARDAANQAAIRWADLHDIARDSMMAPVRAIPSTAQFFAPLAGFAELLNDQAWCECGECQSVLSPAAYFVDLMYYIEQNILVDSFKGQQDHPLHLQVRRPDLWDDLELTCENTNTYIPYLDIVNEVLKKYINAVEPNARTTGLYVYLAQQEESFKQPFTFPLERLEILVSHFGLSRYEVAKTMSAPTAIRARTRLKISLKEYDLITGERAGIGNLPFLKKLYKLDPALNVATTNAVIPPIEMQVLTHAAGLSHEVLQKVLSSAFVNSDGSANSKITVILGKRTADDVQNNSEVVQNLSLKRLDRIHRLVRLWRTLPWTIGELDYVLERTSRPDAVARIDEASIEKILDLLEVNEPWSLPIDEVMALSDEFPKNGLREPISLFDRLFNQQPFLDRDGNWPPAIAAPFTHPAWKKTDPKGVSAPDSNALTRLLAALQITDKELIALIESLTAVPALGYQPAAAANPPRDQRIQLTAESIGILYRHARLMRLVQTPVADFVKLLALSRVGQRQTADRFIRDLDDVKAVAELVRWQKASGFTADEIVYLTDSAAARASMDAAALAAGILNEVQGRKYFDFADTLFTQLGLTDVKSRQLVADNTTTAAANKAFIRLADGTTYRLRDGVDPADVPLTLDPNLDAATIRELLRNYHCVRILDVSLAGALQLSREEVEVIRAITHAVLSNNEATQITGAMQGRAANAPLTDLITGIVRVRALLKSKLFDLKSLRFVRDNAARFGLPDDPVHKPIPIQAIRNVSAYVALATVSDADFTTAAAPVDIDAVHRVLVNVGAAVEADLARTLRTDNTRVAALQPHVLPLPANPFDALAVLARCLVLTEQLGVSGETLKLITSDAVDAISRAAEDIFGAFRAKYPEEKTFQEKIEPFEDKLRGRKRDGLVDFMINRWPEPFANANALYDYFLLDVQMQGCSRTSKVVAATSSLQLYVHRVLMNLERSSDWDGTVPAKRGVYAYFSIPNKKEEWSWRQYYRVWQANRKVFLYPENYLEPELRDDKTPLFKDLEDTLLQQEINEASVQDAYARYLTGFDEVGHLKIAGTYYEADVHVLHLFGVTSDTPPVYYHRVITDTESTPPRLGPWRKLNVQIPATKVSVIRFAQRLYVFWIEVTTRPVTSFMGGSTQFQGYRHLVRIKYSTLRADGRWTAPQSLGFAKGNATEDARSIDDPQLNDAGARKKALQKEIDDKKAVESELEKAQDSAVQDLDAATTELGQATGALSAPSTANEQAEATSVRLQAEILAAGAVGAALPFGPVAVEQAMRFARLGRIALAVNSSVEGLLSAGVSEFDTPFMARRRIRVLVATVIVNARTVSLSAVRQALATVRADLDRLRKALNGIVVMVKWDQSGRDHSQPVDNYKPEGWQWDRVYTDVHQADTSLRLVLVPRNDADTNGSDKLDLPVRLLRPISEGSGSESASRPRNAYGQIALVNATNNNYVDQEYYLGSFFLNSATPSTTLIATVPATADVQVVNGDPASITIESEGDAILLRKVGTGPYIGTRLGTTATSDAINFFSYEGAAGLLDAGAQDYLSERRHPSSVVTVAGQSKLAIPDNPFDKLSPYLTYYRETYFHIPFLIANHLNSQQKFAEAQQWYHYIFNPTAVGGPWRYREFRDPHPVTRSLRSLLIDVDSLRAYREDAFSPHAIARTRLSAYQKSTVMKYIDNLLDWGDSLFAQFTMESVNEATLLYVMAQDILGPKPEMLGSCGEGKVSPKNYRTIRPALSAISDFLIELELPATTYINLVYEGSNEQGLVLQVSQYASTAAGNPVLPAEKQIAFDASTPGAAVSVAAGYGVDPLRGKYWTNVGGTPLNDLYGSHSGIGGFTVLGTDNGGRPPSGRTVAPIDFVPPEVSAAGGHFGVPGGGKIQPFDQFPPLDLTYDLRDRSHPLTPFQDKKFPPRNYEPVEIVPPKNLVFCIPANKELRAYWTRVEDRLFKIRNCMNIAGVRRSLELFSPEIDPRLLVRMKARGLTLDDVLNSTAGNLPPYRFTYLIEKARQYAGTLQSFGSQLQSAIEKRDAEELGLLRTVHEQNLLKMRSRMVEMEIEAAEDALENLRRQQTAIDYRIQYFSTLSETGMIASERTQQQLQRMSSQFRTQAGVAQMLSSVLSIIPDVGAYTAMKFGGSQLGAAGRSVAEGLNALASFNDMSASMAGTEATNRRRDQEWRHQVEMARNDKAQVEKQIDAAKVRKEIAVGTLAVHEKSVDQAEEVFTLFNEKFSSFGRYTLLSNRLHSLYRVAFNAALSMAKMAEQAYRAERTDEAMLDGSYWDAETGGLLAGERLLNDLQALERRFIESNYRQFEVEQSYSLALYAPDALESLRLDGKCRFEIPEWFFNLTYPGQYGRRLKAVRLTIPCVTGPFTNVGAMLRLESSRIRFFDETNQEFREKTVPLRHTVGIAASKAQYDSGVFDFNFRDERYMPFEGGGALSTWELSLPKTLRAFHYDTIRDAILHLSYTADFDPRLRDTLEEGAESLVAKLRTTPLIRVFSLRDEFPDTFHRLMNSPANTEATFSIESKHFPFFLGNRPLNTGSVELHVHSTLQDVAGARFAIGERTQPDAAEEPKTLNLKAPDPVLGAVAGPTKPFEFIKDPPDQDYKGVAAALLGKYMIKLTAAGKLARNAPGNAQGALDPEKLYDVLLEIRYSLA